MAMMRYHLICWAIVMAWLPTKVIAENKSCERLKASLTYTQEEAPRDLSSVVSPGVKTNPFFDVLSQRLACFVSPLAFLILSFKAVDDNDSW